ncbi:hypothetical protein PCANC_23545 [Puccinia coronata f. sp. avenae]|uniref:Sphingolipid long chain base-responsive protein LSP1 n=1 Tax=Puccinia coronata f. sp. avenae TaxID=200324 RepID=A0A2N5VMI5_9BASI|nr:hypothetical protein PCANC_23545 [Puccinia coronata f. sp. avenae]PLW26354.1 hypothetical protein PCASD_20712 [Puccinia coronata f. sp. avenae]PLW51219.1 hypothetical protein PCASD_01030 [Puccinia coronata f. sp. avenae]
MPNANTSTSKVPHSKRAMLGSVFNQITEITNINNLRQFQATYDPRQAAETLKLQLLIKAQKSLVIDSEGLARDSHMLSKQLYLWACDEPDHALKDVGDRLAYMNYQLGDLQQQYAQKMETSRSDLKEIRNLENELLKLRDREKSLQNQLNKLLQDGRAKAETSEKISSLTAERAGVIQKVQETEAMIPDHKRRLIQSSYRTQFQALREMGDKLMIISQFGDLLLDQLDPDHPHLPYTAHHRTAQIKGAASQILNDYNGPVFSKPNNDLANFQFDSPAQISEGSSSLHRTDTRLFGETHHHVLAEGANDPHGASHAGTSSNVNTTRPSTSTAGTAPINHQPALLPSSQPPKLPKRPSSTFPNGTSGSNNQAGGNSEKQSALAPAAALQHALPTVAEVGPYVPMTTNGPAHGTLLPPHHHTHDQPQPQPHHSEDLPAYSSVAPDKP